MTKVRIQPNKTVLRVISLVKCGSTFTPLVIDYFKSNLCVLATTKKHMSVCQSADKEYLKNVNRMMVKYNLKHKVKEFHEGDCVTVRIPRIDRSSTDPNRLPCIIVQVEQLVQCIARSASQEC